MNDLVLMNARHFERDKSGRERGIEMEDRLIREGETIKSTGKVCISVPRNQNALEVSSKKVVCRACDASTADVALPVA
jgi:hypothetical protein